MSTTIELPPVNEIREKLAVVARERTFLQDLLKVAERHERRRRGADEIRAARQQKQGVAC